MNTENNFPKRAIKSFVIREGRLSLRQEHAIQSLWEKYVLPTDALLDWEAVFGEAPITLEIGFGMGDALLQNARANPDKNFIGIEVYRPGIGRVLSVLDAENIQNVRILYGDAVEILQRCVPDCSLTGVHIFFPDPWPKRRHQKRRLIQTEFVQLLAKKLKPEGILHVATDWEDYAEHMRRVLSPLTEWVQLPEEAYKKNRPLTKYEQRGKRLGHAVWDGVWEKRS